MSKYSGAALCIIGVLTAVFGCVVMLNYWMSFSGFFIYFFGAMVIIKSLVYEEESSCIVQEV